MKAKARALKSTASAGTTSTGAHGADDDDGATGRDASSRGAPVDVRDMLVTCHVHVHILVFGDGADAEDLEELLDVIADVQAGSSPRRGWMSFRGQPLPDAALSWIRDTIVLPGFGGYPTYARWFYALARALMYGVPLRSAAGPLDQEFLALCRRWSLISRRAVSYLLPRKEREYLSTTDDVLPRLDAASGVPVRLTALGLFKDNLLRDSARFYERCQRGGSVLTDSVKDAPSLDLVEQARGSAMDINVVVDEEMSRISLLQVIDSRHDSSQLNSDMAAFGTSALRDRLRLEIVAADNFISFLNKIISAQPFLTHSDDERPAEERAETPSPAESYVPLRDSASSGASYVQRAGQALPGESYVQRRNTESDNRAGTTGRQVDDARARIGDVLGDVEDRDTPAVGVEGSAPEPPGPAAPEQRVAEPARTSEAGLLEPIVVTVKELRSRIGKILDAVEAGQPYIVRAHGTWLAELRVRENVEGVSQLQAVHRAEFAVNPGRFLRRARDGELLEIRAEGAQRGVRLVRPPEQLLREPTPEERRAAERDRKREARARQRTPAQADRAVSRADWARTRAEQARKLEAVKGMSVEDVVEARRLWEESRQRRAKR